MNKPATFPHSRRKPGSQNHGKHFLVKTYQIPSQKIEPGRQVRLAFLSDLHGLSFGSGNIQLLRAVEHAAPDLILVGGDMVVGKLHPKMDAAAGLLGALARKFPVYYAFGNHERRMAQAPEKYGDALQEFCESLGRQGVHFLRNERACAGIMGGIPFSIWGLDADMYFYKRFWGHPMKTGYLKKVLGRPEKEAFHILLAHNPQFGRTYFSWGADLILSGHYHGGIWRFSENRGLAAPNYRLFPAFCCGHFTQGEQHMVVSPGLGEHTIPFRIRNPRELIILEIVHGGDKKWQSR